MCEPARELRRVGEPRENRRVVELRGPQLEDGSLRLAVVRLEIAAQQRKRHPPPGCDALILVIPRGAIAKSGVEQADHSLTALAHDRDLETERWIARDL